MNHEAPCSTLSTIRTRFVASLTLLALALAVLPATSVHAANYMVTTLADSGIGSLREAITQANATADTDSIGFSVTGTIVLQSTLPTISGKLFINGPGASSLTISGNDAVQVFNLTSGSDLTLDGVTVSNARGVLTSNGGAITNEGGTLTVSNSLFSNNRTLTNGSAIANEGGTLTVSNSTFSNNNSSGSTGAIYTSSGTVTISNSTFSNNNSSGSGGVIDILRGTVTISNSTFSNNSAIVGGAINNRQGILIISNSTFANNSASGDGGAINNVQDTLTVSNSTFFNNSASRGGGIYSPFVSAIVKNTIIANSPSGGNCAGRTLTDSGGNISSDGTCFTVSTSRTNTDPLLDPNGLQDNGGPTLTIALQPDSPAIDAAVDCPPPASDQRGVTRPQGAGCDSGAYEYIVPNTAPTANNDSYSVNEDMVLTGNVLTNDTDLDSDDTLTASVVGQPNNGTLDFDADGSFTYTPNANFNGSDSFTYNVNDGTVDSNVATVSITVNAVNDAPTVAVAAGGSCRSDSSGRINLTLADDDSSSSNLTVSASSSNASLVPVNNVVFGGTGANRTATITAVSGKTGTATITLTVSDGTLNSSTTVTLSVGGNGVDTLEGTDGADILFGQNSNDTLNGNGGNDLLCGGNGDDALNGGADNDTLNGRRGADRFDGGAGTDTVTDFKSREGDTQANIP